MEKLDLKSRVLLVRLYYENGSSSAAALRRYKTLNGLRDDPFPARFVERLLHKFEEHGTVLDLPHGGRMSVNEDEVLKVKECLERGQSSSEMSIYSARAVSRESGIPKTTVLKIMKERLRLRPYHLKMVQELKETDYSARMEFADWFLDQEDDFQQRVLWTDEAHFQLDGSFSTKN